MTALAELARRHGVAPEYATDRGERIAVAPENLRRVLAALGVDPAGPDPDTGRDRPLPSCVVVRQGRRAESAWPAATYAVRTETGDWHDVADPAGDLGRLPLGYHTLHAEVAGRSVTAPLIVAPDVLATPDRRRWGLLAQIYSVLSAGSWGMGDLGDLSGLATWSGRLGASFVLLNPLHAYVPGPLPDPSPYRPGTRRFPDPMNLRIEAIPEYAALRGQVDALAVQGRALTDGVLHRDELIDRAAVWALKREALEPLHRVPRTAARQAAYDAYVAGQGAGLTDYATWCAIAEVHGSRWRSWPAGLRTPDGAAVARVRRDLADRVDFHRWLNWLVDEQMAAAQAAATGAGMAIGLVHDLAVGVDPEGADAWRLQRFLAGGITIGCPPDNFNAGGQDWGLPPWRPDTLAEAGYEPFAEVVRGVLRHCGALRLDHIMGLFRLWWIPEGAGARAGAYVHYDHEALLGVLALEAHRAGAMVIGEDLGTVERRVRDELTDRRILGTSVLRFEYRGGSEERGGPLPAADWRADCLATLTTHDLPSTAAWLAGDHVDLHDRLGLLTRDRAEVAAEEAAERDGWLAELDRGGFRSAADGVPGLDADTLALHRFLAHTPARLLGVWLPDLVGDRRPQNLPGTVDEFPNWRLPVADPDGRPVSLERLTEGPGPTAIAHLYSNLDDDSPQPFGRWAPPTVSSDGASDAIPL
ncbi:4-alpha-glucanotransferase [Polymorphospora sp. NPDC050346]|uniref:4-alpha-glucanotransferase n=1 Tax=Polymorphospora sp. NPDC050346 TaxID=3155780 RepID=UPI0033DB29EF